MAKIIRESQSDIITNSVTLWTLPMYSNRFTGTKTIITLPDKLYNNWDRFKDMWTESHSEIVNASQILRGDYKYFQCINGLDIDWGPFCSSSSYSQFNQDEANHPKVMQNSPGQSVYWCLIKSALAIMTKTKNPTFHPLDCETFYTLSVWALPPPHWGKHQHQQAFYETFHFNLTFILLTEHETIEHQKEAPFK